MDDGLFVWMVNFCYLVNFLMMLEFRCVLNYGGVVWLYCKYVVWRMECVDGDEMGFVRELGN